MQIVLASASPRRKELLEKIGLKFIVDASDFPEDAFNALPPLARAKKLSAAKAFSVASRHPESIIIAADTFGVIGRKTLGKPGSPDEAENMLISLSGRMHRAVTGLTVMDTTTDKTISRVVQTRVYMRQLTREEIIAYVKTGEPLGKAAAYAIQGIGSVLIDHIDGDFYNVVGLPLAMLAEMLKKFGVQVLKG